MHRSFSWIVSSTFALFTWWVSQATAASAIDRADLLRYLEGSYKLVGKEADSDKTFLGKVVLKKRGTKLDVVRLIDGARIRGIGWIDFVTADRIKILRMRFHTSKGQTVSGYS
jgi:hypothetical protein